MQDAQNTFLNTYCVCHKLFFSLLCLFQDVFGNTEIIKHPYSMATVSMLTSCWQPEFSLSLYRTLPPLSEVERKETTFKSCSLIFILTLCHACDTHVSVVWSEVTSDIVSQDAIHLAGLELTKYAGLADGPQDLPDSLYPMMGTQCLPSWLSFFVVLFF